MSINIEKLMQAALPVSEKERKEADFRKENKEWLRKSAKIALAIRRELRLKGMTQQDLAAKMGLSPQYVGRILKGQENLTLETISKLEAAIGISLVSLGNERQVETKVVETQIICFCLSAIDDWDTSPKTFSKREKQAIANS